ncbi:hypothetical protein GF339_11085 [candidate division KSB3 bacterium]|uniref:PilZ domain-containing protein n=1 Tax=candidate division KSB3 bacterium TaxID=2044937 RepID=A0A9D5JVX4_9BACT|nr:hypothetical protein [candidate division KSB3 bacterium]MBD3325120.1 hypothetical protein [candidate division KSB3 bacterium]
MDTHDKRRHYRIALNSFVRFYEGPLETSAPHYRQGVIKDYSDGGLRISTTQTLPKGSVVTVEIPIETSDTGELKIVQVQGILRWIQDVPDRPDRQMLGIEFFEFMDSEHQTFNAWMEHLLE